jgi:hypothetical protein
MLVGTKKGLSINKDPASGWKAVAALGTWQQKLPAAYVYRVRAIQPAGEPVSLPRLGGNDADGLLYIGHTGPQNEKLRLYRLAQELVGRTNGYRGHGVGKRYWDHGVDVALQRLCDAFSLQVGWDEQTDFVGLANPDCRKGAPLGGAGTIATSRKELARGEESKLLDEYSRAYGELPPLNHQVGEWMRDEDELTGHAVADDFTPALGKRLRQKGASKKKTGKKKSKR